MNNDIDLGALRALTVVAQERSMSAACVHLGISQQAVSLKIRQLERTFGVRLLNRSARGSEPTPAGELVVGWARPLLEAARDFGDSVATLRADRGSTVTVAASLTIAEHLVPEWIARWRANLGHSAPAIQLTAENSSLVIEAVRQGEADIGFIETPNIPNDLSAVVIAHDTIEVVVQRGHPWASRHSISVRQLAQTPLVLRELGSGTRETLDEALANAGHPRSVEPAMVLDNTLGVRSAIIGGVAPGALSLLAVNDDIRAGRLVSVRVSGLKITRPLTAIWAGNALPQHIRPFLEQVLRRARS